VGTALALALVRGGHRVVAAVDGGGGSATALAGRIAGLRPGDDPVAAVEGADLVLVTTADGMIEDVVTTVALADGWRTAQRVVHCSGVLGLEPLRRAALAGARIAAVHPAQTVPSGAGPDELLGVSWAVTAGPADRGWAHELVTDLGGDPFDLPAAARTLYHAGLVLGANAAGGAVAAARQLLAAARVPDPGRVLGPIVAAGTANVVAGGAEALTGPVVRGDVATVRAHLAALDADLPGLAAQYRALQGVVLAQVRPALDPAVATAIEDALAAPPTG
jgi:predicted short-subunit dehydrogenase-like oxidoreductase (DUF2520 family)